MHNFFLMLFKLSKITIELYAFSRSSQVTRDLYLNGPDIFVYAIIILRLLSKSY